MEILDEIAAALQAGDDARVSALTATALEARLSAEDVLQRGLLSGMNVVGEQFRAREIFLPDVLMAARAMHAGLALLKPLLESQGVEPRGKVVIGTVKGDLHDIGKNLVAIMLRGAGYEVIDLGHDVAPEAFVDAAVRERAPLIGLSALLTTTMPRMREVIDVVRQRELTGKVRTIVGGAPLNADFAREIGADGYACDAAQAVDRVTALLGAA